MSLTSKRCGVLSCVVALHGAQAGVWRTCVTVAASTVDAWLSLASGSVYRRRSLVVACGPGWLALHNVACSDLWRQQRCSVATASIVRSLIAMPSLRCSMIGTECPTSAKRKRNGPAADRVGLRRRVLASTRRRCRVPLAASCEHDAVGDGSTGCSPVVAARVYCWGRSAGSPLCLRVFRRVAEPRVGHARLTERGAFAPTRRDAVVGRIGRCCVGGSRRRARSEARTNEP